jgi:hypothetical protein
MFHATLTMKHAKNNSCNIKPYQSQHQKKTSRKIIARCIRLWSLQQQNSTFATFTRTPPEHMEPAPAK